MELRGRKVLLCGGKTPIDDAILRELARARADVVVRGRADEGEQMPARRAGAGRRAAEPTWIDGDLSSAAGCAAIVDRAWGVAGRLDALVLHPVLVPLPGDLHAEERAWGALLASGLKWPFFLAREAGLRMRPAGGRLIFVAESERGHSSGGFATGVACAGLVTMAGALAKALAPAVAVSTIVVARRAESRDTKEVALEKVARAVRFLLAEGPGASGAVVELGMPDSLTLGREL